MKFAIYDRSRRGFLEGGDFRTILWGCSDLSIDDAKLYNDKKKAETAAKSMTTYYQQTSARPDFQQQIDQLCKVSFSQYELAGLTRYEPIVVFDKLRRDDWFKKQRSFNKLKNYERVDPSSKLITWKEAVKISKQTNGDFQEETT